MFLKNIKHIEKNGIFLYFGYRQFSEFSKKAVYTSVIEDTIENANISSVLDWKKIRETILKHVANRGMYSEKNIDAILLNYCIKKKNVNKAILYWNFIDQESIPKNLTIQSKYLNLLYIKNEECLTRGKKCPIEDEELIIKHYTDLRKEYDVLDPFTLESIIPALSITRLWKTCLNLLNEIQISAVPNSFTYSAVISAAFLNGEENLAWNLLSEMVANDKVPNNIAYFSYIASISKTQERTFLIDQLDVLFNFFREHNIKCNQEFVRYFHDFGNLNSNFIEVTRRGLCKNCNQHLNKFDISNEEFEELKQQMFEHVIIGKDIFIKTTPEELNKFKNFVKQLDKHDVVLDGLNVAFSAGTKHSPEVYSALVAAVVSHFVCQKKKILLLGRQHMNKWPKRNWSFITQNSTIFLTQNISQDDPYLLYCALHSGKDTIIVTRDLMRGQRFLLKLPKYKILFNRWLTLRQYQILRIDNKGTVIFKEPPAFSAVAQKNTNNWHIPYVTENTNNENNSFHKMWLCVDCN